MIRKTKILCTLGPATDSQENVGKLIAAGADLFRLNMSHGTHDWVKKTVKNIRAAAREHGREVAILMDLRGPSIRTGDLKKPINLAHGDKLFLQTREEGEVPKGAAVVGVNYPGLSNDLSPGDTLLIEGGSIQALVLESNENGVLGKITQPGELTSRRHVNLPGVKVGLPALTRKDFDDIDLAAELGEDIDFVALSFAREGEHVSQLEAMLIERGSKARPVAKIENQQAIDNLDEIIIASGAVMVARGDLGTECPIEELPIIQRRIIERCSYHGRKVIVATEMLESMTESPVPTRAEVTDVYNAANERVDCVMLSGETSIGKYPDECVRVLDKICRKVEETYPRGRLVDDAPLHDDMHKTSAAAVGLAGSVEGSKLLVFTQRGKLGHTIAHMRPEHAPIFTFSPAMNVVRSLLMARAVIPFQLEFQKTPEKTVERAIQLLKDEGFVKDGDPVVITSDVLPQGESFVDSIFWRKA